MYPLDIVYLIYWAPINLIGHHNLGYMEMQMRSSLSSPQLVGRLTVPKGIVQDGTAYSDVDQHQIADLPEEIRKHRKWRSLRHPTPESRTAPRGWQCTEGFLKVSRRAIARSNYSNQALFNRRAKKEKGKGLGERCQWSLTLRRPAGEPDGFRGRRLRRGGG